MLTSPLFLFVAIAAIAVLCVVEPTIVQLLFLFFSLVFPKLPILQIEGYLVPIRTEDFFLAFAFFVLLLRFVIYREKVAPHPLFKWMFLYCVVTFVSFVFGLFILHTVPDGKIGFLYWMRGPEYFAASFLCGWGISNWKRFGRVVAGLIVFVALIGIYGILQEYGLVPAFDAMHTTDEMVMVRFLPGFGEERLFSTFGGPYDLSAFYLLAAPLCMALIAGVESRMTKFGLCAVLGLSLVCFYLTFARTPLPAMAVSLYVCLVLLGKRRMGTILALLCTIPPFLMVGFQARLQEALSDPLAEYALGNRLRTAWADAFDAMLRSPVLGTGPASLHNMMGVDGLYMLLLGTWGIAGLVCFSVLIYKTLKYLRRMIDLPQHKLQRAAAIGMYAGTIGLLINGVTIDTFFSSKIAFPYWFLMGLMSASSQLGAKQTARPVGAPVRAKFSAPLPSPGSAALGS